LQICERPRGDGPALGNHFIIAAPTTYAFRTADADRWEQPKIDVHRLETAGAAIALRLDVAAGDMGHQGAEGCGGRRHRQVASRGLGGSEPTGDQADGSTLDV